MAAGVVAGVVALVGLFVVRSDARYLFDGLTSRALPLVVVSALAGLGALAAASGPTASRGPAGRGRCGGRARARLGSRPVGLPAARIADRVAGGGADRNDHGRARRDRSRRLLIVPAFVLLYVLDQKGLLPEEGVDEGPEHATGSRRPDGSLGYGP